MEKSPLGDFLSDVIQALFELGILFCHGFDAAAGGDGGGVIGTVEQNGDPFIRKREHVVAEIHGDLPGNHHLLIPPLGHEALKGDMKIIRHDLLDAGGVTSTFLSSGRRSLRASRANDMVMGSSFKFE